MNEHEIVSAAIAGDEKAFELLIKQNHKKIFSILYKLTMNRQDAEDLCQISYTKVFTHLHTFKFDSKFSTWIYRIALNTFLMTLRRKKVEILPIFDETEDSRESKFLIITDTSLSSVPDKIRLKKAISELPNGFRTVFIMHEIMGYKHYEIARVQGTSIGSSKSQLSKAKKRLKEKLLKV